MQESKFISFKVKPRVKSKMTLSKLPNDSKAFKFLTKIPSSISFLADNALDNSADIFNP